ncbi:MAG: 3-deoxy-7-phosphoheptulonate synthase, partial [Lachnospiraceae bacterium]|nr:3-deoxy-7-phosphoheptulonate synthase [Lachnospiraceae bacterium]
MLVSRENHPADTVIKVNNTTVGGGNLTIIAGPCSVESEEQILNIARAVKENGATMLRGGAFKPRTSPYSFQGLGKEALNYLSIAKKETGLPVITEITDVRELELFDDIDVIQIGARNMQNFALLKEVGKSS